MTGRRPSKRDRITLLLSQGETSSTIIANKVGCAVAYVNVVKNELLKEQLRSQKSHHFLSLL